MNLSKITTYLDKLLKLEQFTDHSNNGLQVANKGSVSSIACGVDASLEFFETAHTQGADMIICHHGISWGDSLKYITELNYQRISYLIENNIALYAAHLPLDAHPRYGNNAQICKALKLQEIKPFGRYGDSTIGFAGKLPKATPYKKLKLQIEKIMQNKLDTLDFGKKTIRTIGVISGGAAAETEQAAQQNLDLYISGEPSLQGYNLAKEYGINVIFAGHYATETFGVKALGRLLTTKFKLKSEFIDFNIKY
jgi:dinuclear metal center YbgI/SA1388 family protein